MNRLAQKKPIFEGIWGYEDTVIPDIERALLSRHDINLLGLRGQAKTRIARQFIHLLDEYIPVVDGSEVNDDPLNPISRFAIDLIQKMGDETPIHWLHRSERYVEKLATPDVSVADLIGDVDPIKAVNEKLAYNDERVIHFGIIPRANRCIFVMNEMPDLQPRIQVALFNILQEGDIQIRGFAFRMPLDIQFVFTANPEDYTNRGSIVTPLKDRIGSQILTHYPRSVEVAKSITKQEARITEDQSSRIEIPELLRDLVEQLVVEARQNEYVDHKSGVSARLSISAMENLVSAAERRALINGEKKTSVRITDLFGVIPSITGKIEMVYEGEQEGPFNVASIIISKAIRSLFAEHFPAVEKSAKADKDPFQRITEWFEKDKRLTLDFQSGDREYAQGLNLVDGLAEVVDRFKKDTGTMERYLWMEFVLYGLAEYSRISRKLGDHRTEFSDLLGSMLGEYN
ncbi:MAG: sigma 54-interacting transcriptional regulator [Flavobacteriales bacterium]|nr:sigma 54-interacting transcriptional regulator [Bacteroidota bacterium]MCB9240861.1 sigma 54-interacting transcriptional regulator [Flavobacteriales bacterium]